MDPSNNHPNPPSRPQRGRGGKTSTPTTPKTPSKRRVKSPPPQETPSRLREHITMRPNADASILGSRMIKANAPMEQDPNATQTGDSAPTSTSPLTIQVQAPSPLAAASDQHTVPTVPTFATRSQSPCPPPSSEQGSRHSSYPPALPYVYTQDGYLAYPQYQNPQAFYPQSSSDAQPPQLYYQPLLNPPPPQHGSTNQIVDNEYHIYQQVAHTMGYRANSFPHMDPKMASTGSWVTQGYPDQYAAVPVP